MEFEDVKEEIRLGARRVAACFGVEEWRLERLGLGECDAWMWYGRCGDLSVRWQMGIGGELSFFQIGIHGMESYKLYLQDVPRLQKGIPTAMAGLPNCKPAFDELMARGLYCLGFDDEQVLAQLPPLSAHEKLELRLSMAREFWPKKWLDEQANPDKGTNRSST